MAFERDGPNNSQTFDIGIGSAKLFHLTVIDIKPAVLARNILVLLMLETIGTHDVELVEKTHLLPCLYYVYLTPITPRAAFDVLQKYVKLAIELLEDHKESLPFLDVAQCIDREC
jgi:hypothetical protein